jgi:hypothetical protein
MLQDFPAEIPIVPEVKRPVPLAGFASELSPPPGAASNAIVRRPSWRLSAVAGLCAGTGLAVAVALLVPGDSQSAPVSSLSNSVPGPKAPAAFAGVGALSEREQVPPVPVGTEAGSVRRKPVENPSLIHSDEIVIRAVVERYRGAYERLDAEAAKMISRSVDERGLARSFSDLESQSLRFDDCRIDIDSARAVATCQGEATYAARAGDRSIRTQTGTWTFELHKNGDDWTIKWVQQSP